jgi:hypothetical protein
MPVMHGKGVSVPFPNAALVCNSESGKQEIEAGAHYLLPN